MRTPNHPFAALTGNREQKSREFSSLDRVPLSRRLLVAYWQARLWLRDLFRGYTAKDCATVATKIMRADRGSRIQVSQREFRALVGMPVMTEMLRLREISADVSRAET